jgi:hypothetical protein
VFVGINNDTGATVTIRDLSHRAGERYGAVGPVSHTERTASGTSAVIAKRFIMQSIYSIFTV